MTMKLFDPVQELQISRDFNFFYKKSLKITCMRAIIIDLTSRPDGGDAVLCA